VRGDVRAARPGELDREAPDATGRPRHEHAPPEQQPAQLERPQRGETRRGQRGGLCVAHAVGDLRQHRDRHRRELGPRAGAQQSGDPRPVLGHPREVPSGHGAARLARQVEHLAAGERDGAHAYEHLASERHRIGHVAQLDMRRRRGDGQGEHDRPDTVTRGCR
jgi:hypothetical protein